MPLIEDRPIDDILSDFNRFKQQVPRFVGTLAVDFFKGSFRRQGFIEDRRIDKWPPRMPTKTDRRTQKTGHTLVKSGRLRRSIRIIRVGKGFVIVGTNVPYAQIHNEGLTINTKASISSHTRRAHTRKSRGRRQRIKAHDVKAHTRHIQFTMPQRRFMGDSNFLNRRITLQTARRLQQIFQNR